MRLGGQLQGCRRQQPGDWGENTKIRATTKWGQGARKASGEGGNFLNF